MKGLLLKDYYVLRSGLYIQLIILIFAGAGMAVAVSAEVLIIISMITLGLCATTSILADKSCKWDMFSRTAPLSKNTVVSSKYILNTLLVLLGMILGVVLAVAATLFTSPINIDEIVVSILIGVSFTFMSSSINIPTSIVLDGTKQTLAMLLSVIFSTIIFIVALLVSSQFIDPKENMFSIATILASVSVVIYLASWIIAPKLLSKRDL